MHWAAEQLLPLNCSNAPQLASCSGGIMIPNLELLPGKVQQCPPASILPREGSWSQTPSCSLPCSREELPLWGARQELFQGVQRCSQVWMHQESLWLCSSIDCKTALTGFRLWLLHVPTDKQKTKSSPNRQITPFWWDMENFKWEGKSSWNLWENMKKGDWRLFCNLHT